MGEGCLDEGFSYHSPLQRSSFLERTIQSVLSQTYHNWEVIMVDDFSKDNSLEVAWLYAGQEQMYGVEKLHKGSRI